MLLCIIKTQLYVAIMITIIKTLIPESFVHHYHKYVNRTVKEETALEDEPSVQASAPLRISLHEFSMAGDWRAIHVGDEAEAEAIAVRSLGTRIGDAVDYLYDAATHWRQNQVIVLLLA